jgi:hypothetical protein
VLSRGIGLGARGFISNLKSNNIIIIIINISFSHARTASSHIIKNTVKEKAKYSSRIINLSTRWE